MIGQLASLGLAATMVFAPVETMADTIGVTKEPIQLEVQYLLDDNRNTGVVSRENLLDTVIQLASLDNNISQSEPRQEQLEDIAQQDGLYYTYLITTDMTSADIIVTLLKALDLRAYNDTLWGVDEYYGTIAEEERAIVSAYHYGLLDNIDISNWNDQMTYSDYKVLLKNIQASDKLNNKPDVVSKFPVVFEVDTDSIVNATYEALDTLPDEILQRFIDEGWTFTVVKSIADTINDDTKVEARGLTDTVLKAILVEAEYNTVNQNTVRHEIGHYVHDNYSAGIFGFKDFLEEKEGISKVLRKYAASSKYEAFADMFAYCYEHYEDELAMSKLYKAAPNCTEFIVNNYVTTFI